MSNQPSPISGPPQGPLLCCSGCKHEFRVPLNLAGRSVACPHCQVNVKVPEFEQATSEEPKDPLVGQEVGGAKLIRRIGAGGLGLVYAGTQLGTNRPVAVKLLGAKAGADPTLVERFKREAQLQASLDHPHIVRAYNATFERGAHVLVMELVEGPTLSGLISERVRLPWGEACRLVGQIAQALDVLHREGIIHRDIKPGNILIGTDRNGQTIAKLADLGLAKEVDGDVEPGMSLTLEGKPLGSPAYMPPEQIQDAKAAGRPADVYGLGASLYQAVTGKRPYDGPSPISIMGAVLKGPPTDVRTLARDLPSTVCDAVAGAMSRDPERRPTASAFASVLIDLAVAAGSGAYRAPSGGYVRPKTEPYTKPPSGAGASRPKSDAPPRPATSAWGRPNQTTQPPTDAIPKAPGTSSWARPGAGSPTPGHGTRITRRVPEKSAVWNESKPSLPLWALLLMVGMFIALAVLTAVLLTKL